MLKCNGLRSSSSKLVQMRTCTWYGFMNLNREGTDLGAKERGLEQLEDDNLESSNWALGAEAATYPTLAGRSGIPAYPRFPAEVAFRYVPGPTRSGADLEMQSRREQSWMGWMHTNAPVSHTQRYSVFSSAEIEL